MKARCPHCGGAIWLRRADPVRDGRGIESLRLSVRAYNCLQRVGIYTIWELQNHDDEELMSIPNFGKTSLADVKKALGEWKSEQRSVS